MQSVSVLFLMLISFSVYADIDESFTQPGPPDTCLAGPFHKDVPSPEEEDFSECLSWQNSSCCNIDLSVSISMHKAVGLYNYSWDLCNEDRPLSQQCEEFIKDEECFYQCEPMLGYFETSPGTGYIAGVPVCADYCERWFQACRDDLTCVEDWLADFDFDQHGYNSCPENSNCVTFAEMYGDARGLCNKMWGTAFIYSEDVNNCTVMKFNALTGNPNSRLTFPTGAQAPTAQLPGAIIITLLLLIAAIAQG